MDFFNKSNLCFSVSASSFSETVLESLSSSTSQKASLASSKRKGKSSRRKDMESLGMIALPLPIRCKLPSCPRKKKETGRLGDSFIHPNFFWRSTLRDTHFELHFFRHLPSTKKVFVTRQYIYIQVYLYIYIWGVSLNGGTQQPWVFLQKMIILGCFGGTTIFGNPHMSKNHVCSGSILPLSIES